MNKLWHSYISEFTNTPENNPKGKANLYNLSENFSLLEITGDDATTYLQGQLTNDISEVENGLAQLSGYCNPKGRLLALFYIFSIDNKYYLQFPSALLPKIIKRMQMFVMMSKVTIRDVSDEVINIGLSGESIDLLINDLPTSTLFKDKKHSVFTKDKLTFIKVSNSQSTPQYQCFGSINDIQTLCSELFKKEVKLTAFETWQMLNIEAGIPSVEENTVEAFIPQMINLHLLDAINFKKGCYTGQEVIARMHYLGKLKRLMYLFTFNKKTNQQVKPGDKLYSPESNSSQGAGKIVSVSCSTILAVAEVSVAGEKALFLDKEQTIELNLGKLPYGLELD